jgi:hypothetical protein
VACCGFSTETGFRLTWRLCFKPSAKSTNVRYLRSPEVFRFEVIIFANEVWKTRVLEELSMAVIDTPHVFLEVDDLCPRRS